MWRIKVFLTSVVLAIIVSFSSYAFMFDMFDINVKVVDDNGVPVDDANAYIGFDKNTSSGTKMSAKKGSTGSGGKFNASGSGNGHIAYGAKKDGYYNSHYTYDFAFYENQKIDYPLSKNFVILLRKIENPVPMYARQAKIELPVSGKEVGFDLVKCDWVIPYGLGTISDFTVYLDMDDKGGNDFEYKVKIFFPEKYDGFYTYDEEIEKGSSFKLQRLANTDGYNNKEIKVLMVGLKRGSKLSWKNNRHYVFRVRSEEKNGKFFRGMYGKIFSDIKLLTARKTGGMPSLSFTYYLNPDYTRNLEFDPKRNLFGNLPNLERVTEP